jgi:hypothetical protein
LKKIGIAIGIRRTQTKGAGLTADAGQEKWGPPGGTLLKIFPIYVDYSAIDALFAESH